MSTIRDITVGVREWIPLIFYATTVILVVILYFQCRKYMRRRATDSSTNPAHQDAN